MLLLVVGLVLFLGVHSLRIVAPGWVKARSAAMGDNTWRGLYSLIAVVGFVLIVYGFSQARLVGPVLYVPPAWISHVVALLMAFAFLAVGIYMFPAGRLKPALKHPMLVAVKIWAFAHLLANGELASVVLFGAFLAWAVVDRVSVKRRGVAVAAPGPVKWDAAAIVVGLALYLLFVWRLHLWLIGVPPISVG